MKHITTLALFALLAIGANAATIKWGASGAAYYETTRMAKDGATAYLVYLGKNASDWSNFNYATDFADSQAASKNTAATGSVGTSNNFIVTENSAIGGISNISAVLTDKESSFGVLFTTTQGGKDYYYLGDTFVFDKSSANFNATTQMYTFTSTVAPSSSATWTPVPEPGTAAMALLGLGMLIRRRRKA